VKIQNATSARSRFDDKAANSSLNRSSGIARGIRRGTLGRWARLRTYEEKGDLVDVGPVRREFERRDSSTAYSARDLHECLARYWEVVAFGSAQVTRREW